MTLLIFIMILIFILILIYLTKYFIDFTDYFVNSNNENSNTFIQSIPNIFYTKQYLDNLYIPSKPNVKPLDNIILSSYFNSPIIINKIICQNITNSQKCWNNNNCQWIDVINPTNSNTYGYCTNEKKMFV